MFKKAGIIGLGLIGGSLAKALRNRCKVSEIVACNRNKDVLETAYSEGVIDAYSTDVTDIFKNCDIVIICTPVSKIFEYAQKLTKYITKDCIVTDVGSTKLSIYENMKTLSDSITYIGGHPMTGSERFRYNASKEHLFENAYYIMTPSDDVPQQKILELKNMIEKIGAIPIVVSPDEHDYITASISHVPHVLAAGLVNTVKNLDSEKGYMHLLAAGGFRDTTRIASSSPDMWESICIENKDNIIDILTSFENVIKNAKELIKNADKKSIHKYFEDAKIYRDSFATTTPKDYVKRYEIAVDVVDKPGSIAIIAVLLSSNNINIKNMGILNSREREEGVLYFAFDTEEQRQKSISLLRGMNYEVNEK